MAIDSDACRAFALRLRTLMTDRGYVSDRSRSGVDVVALSKGARVSYEMARRYAEGLAMPRPDVLDAIAAWLDVDPSALAYGTVHGHKEKRESSERSRCAGHGVRRWP